MKLRRRGATTAGVLAAVALGATGVAYATGGISGDVIHGCYKANGGQFRIGANCTKKEKPLAWSVQGPKGDTGAQGPQGPQGPKGLKGDKGEKGDKGDRGLTGATGPAGHNGAPGTNGTNGMNGAPGAPGLSGIAGYEVLTHRYELSSDPRVVWEGGLSTAPCPAGKVLIGGGASISYPNHGESLQFADLDESYPSGSQWVVSVVTSDNAPFANDHNVTVYSICATGTA